MSMKIYEQIGFSIQRAKTLIAMIQKAVAEFYDFKGSNLPYKSWEDTKGSSVEINNKKYDVLTRLAVDEYWYGPNNFKKVRFKDVFTGDLGRAFRDRVPFGFILQSSGSENEIYVVIRGTQTKPEWYNNLSFTPGEESFLNLEILGKVHRGFQNIYTKENRGKRKDSADDLDPIQKVIEDTLGKCKPESEVFVAGHSLGAALATLAAAHVNYLSHFSQPPTLYTFASPRVGNKQFSQYVENQLKASYRVINSEDIIAAIPLASPRLISEQNIQDAIAATNFKALADPLLALLPNLDFYHIGQVIPFTLHMGSVLENHIAATYARALDL